MSNLLGFSLMLLFFVFGALNGALMLASPATYKRLSFRLAYLPHRLLHRTVPVAIPARGPDLQYRLQGLGIFAMFSCMAGLMSGMVIREAKKVPLTTVTTLPQAVYKGSIWSAILPGLFFISMGALLLLKPDITQYWAEMRMGRVEPRPSGKNLRMGSGILAACLIALGLIAIWFGVRCSVSACH